MLCKITELEQEIDSKKKKKTEEDDKIRRELESRYDELAKDMNFVVIVLGIDMVKNLQHFPMG